MRMSKGAFFRSVTILAVFLPSVHPAFSAVEAPYVSEREPQTVLRSEISLTGKMDFATKKVSFDFSVPAKFFPEGSTLKLVYSQSDPAVTYDGKRWIWYSGENLGSTAYQISVNRWVSGVGNETYQPSWGEGMRGYFRLCAVNDAVRNCSKTPLRAEDLETVGKTDPAATKTATVQKTVANDRVSDTQVNVWIASGRWNVDISWKPGTADYAVLLLFMLAGLAYWYRQNALLKRLSDASSPAVKLSVSKTVHVGSHVGSAVAAESVAPPIQPPQRFSPLSLELKVLRIFRSGNEYRLEFGDLYEKGVKVPESNRANLLSELSGFVRAMHRIAPVRGPADALAGFRVEIPNLEKFGNTLYRLLIPERVREALETSHGPLVIRTDDQEIPWELLHNGREFLSLMRPLGREILTTANIRKNPVHRRDVPKILLIADPTSDLAGAREEAVKIAALFANRAEIRVLLGSDATASAIFSVLSESDWDVVHYAGHARFHEDVPDESGLVLSGGQTVSVTEIKRVLSGRPLVFLNACSSGVSKADESVEVGASGLDTVGLSSAFVVGGALGTLSTLWPVHDTVASSFSSTFYGSLLAGRTVGESVLDAKRVAKGNDPSGVNWAAFAYYWNPNSRLGD